MYITTNNSGSLPTTFLPLHRHEAVLNTTLPAAAPTHVDAPFCLPVRPYRCQRIDHAPAAEELVPNFRHAVAPRSALNSIHEQHVVMRLSIGSTQDEVDDTAVGVADSASFRPVCRQVPCTIDTDRVVGGYAVGNSDRVLPDGSAIVTTPATSARPPPVNAMQSPAFTAITSVLTKPKISAASEQQLLLS